MHTAFLVIALIAIALQGIALWLAFFGRGLRYEVKEPPGSPLDSSEFCRLLAFLTEAKLLHGNNLEVLTNGPCFYEAQLTAIASARSSHQSGSIYFSQRRDRKTLRGRACRTRPCRRRRFA